MTDPLAPALREAGMVSSALWTDVDQDGWPDLLLALEWGGVKYWHNDEGRTFTIGRNAQDLRLQAWVGGLRFPVRISMATTASTMLLAMRV